MTVGRITQEAVEVLRSGDPNARITQEVVEVLRSGDATARVTQVVVEVLRSVADFVPAAPVNPFAHLTNNSHNDNSQDRWVHANPSDILPTHGGDEPHNKPPYKDERDLGLLPANPRQGGNYSRRWPPGGTIIGTK